MQALQQNPIVVEVLRQPAPAPDISLETAVSWFALAGIFLLVAAVGSLAVGVGMLLYKRWQESALAEGEVPESHTRLRL